MKKKLISLLLLIPILSFAELNIQKINNALVGIKSTKKELTFYNGDKDLLPKLEEKSKVKFTSSTKADILLFSEKENKGKALIVNNYQQLKDKKDSIGAIYIKKGRTQIVFVKERLEAKGLESTEALNEYLITECHFNPQCFLHMQ